MVKGIRVQEMTPLAWLSPAMLEHVVHAWIFVKRYSSVKKFVQGTVLEYHVKSNETHYTCCSGSWERVVLGESMFPCLKAVQRLLIKHLRYNTYSVEILPVAYCNPKARGMISRAADTRVLEYCTVLVQYSYAGAKCRQGAAVMQASKRVATSDLLSKCPS
ncbi:hypothetical protein HOY82DRAFT_415832 [Tuber indicum]|nr:hypothetical protein HOY82DRAFT_415832 [Tuber indicum]